MSAILSTAANPWIRPNLKAIIERCLAINRAEAGTEHFGTSTDEGCLLHVISYPQSEVLR
mgnify:FL=1